ncbi:unnamed protein product [Rotaria magnacalcarata]|uniref:NAD(P)(+)--arginine ADP-ribosyltransferase n=1 Tax=Rotaria magnacalcarata TaxID=392030 RepID=A0A816S6L4_9BILA|nr:unnamed protein product [Rotaria magnacalcarata]
MPADLPTPTISKNDQYQDLSKVLTDPRRIIPIRGASESAMAASNNFLVVFTDNDISMFNVHFCEKKYNKWNDGSIVDICFCSSDIGFVLLTVSNVFIFSARNHNHINVATIQPFEDKTFSNCTSNGKSLLISYRIPGTPIDEIDTSTWKLKKRWKSPNICNCDEYISRLRYSLDFSEIGIIVYLRPRIRFQLCDSNMNTLRTSGNLYDIPFGDFGRGYFEEELTAKGRTLAFVVDEAAKGIVNEGTALGKAVEAKWLAEQLLGVKHHADGIEVSGRCWTTLVPSAIGETCIYLYTKESFWYKLLNRVMRDPFTITRKHVTSLGPFCWLLYTYLPQRSNPSVEIVYRGLTLTEEEREDFMQDMFFTDFTSTSKNREKSEQFGNTLLVIGNLRYAGGDIAALSDFPDEEEFLLYPSTHFECCGYEYYDVKKKHIIYFEWAG